MPSSNTSPAIGGWLPINVLSSVDLPLPLGPITAVSWPPAARNDSTSTTIDVRRPCR